MIVEALADLKALSCIIDGEAVAYPNDGIACFDLCNRRIHIRVCRCSLNLASRGDAGGDSAARVYIRGLSPEEAAKEAEVYSYNGRPRATWLATRR